MDPPPPEPEAQQNQIEITVVHSEEAAQPERTPQEVIKERQQWSNQIEFVLALVGYAVGLGNVWRFPYLCYKNGGGAFLIPYLTVLFVLGIPLFMVELAIGQRFQLGAVEVWKQIHPRLQGLGMASTIVSLFVALYYNIILAWSLYYFFRCFSSTVPWAPSDEEDSQNAADVFWREVALKQSSGLGDITLVNWNMWGCLAFAWVLVYFCIFKGVHSSGKVVYFTATFPYFVLAVLLIRGLTLPGALDGLHFYLVPDWSKVANLQVWVDAANQIFYSLGLGWGTLITFASFNRKDHDLIRDATMIPLINCGTSIFAGMVIFSVLGFLAFQKGVSVEDVVDSKTGLAFIVYPAGLGEMPLAPLFSFFFFLMLICLGIDSQFAMVEVVMTAIHDKNMSLKKAHTAAALCVTLFLGGFIFVTDAGVYWVDLMDSFSATVTLFSAGFLEAIAVGWIYGAERFQNDVLEMTGRKIWTPVLLVIKYLAPPILLFLLISTVVSSAAGDYSFPGWGVFLGWMVALMSFAPLPIYGLKNYKKRVSSKADPKLMGKAMKRSDEVETTVL